MKRLLVVLLLVSLFTYSYAGQDDNDNLIEERLSFSVDWPRP